MHKTKDAEIDKPRVTFICVHNSCRSQIAEALGKHLASDVFESYSAGTETKNRINPDAVRIIKQLYGIDMEETQHPKLLEDIPLWILLLQWDAMSNVHICLVGTERTGAWMIRP
jgi:arsenate reductase